MIRRIENLSDVRLDLRDSHYSRTILSHMRAYGTDFDFCELYEIVSRDRTAGFIACYNSSLVADYVEGAKLTNGCLREMAEFIAFKSPSSAELPQKLCPKTGFRGYSRIKRTFFTVPYGDTSQGLSDEPNIDHVFNTVYGLESGGDYGLWLTDTIRRRNRAMLRLYSYNSSVLTVRFMINGQAYITDVATPPVDRGKGYAAELLKKASFALYKDNFKSYLCAKEPAVGYYKRLNFPELGIDYIFEKKERLKDEQLF